MTQQRIKYVLRGALLK